MESLLYVYIYIIQIKSTDGGNDTSLVFSSFQYSWNSKSNTELNVEY